MTFNRQSAPEGVGKTLGNGQAQAKPLDPTATGFLRTKERCEDMNVILVRYPASLILHRQPNEIINSPQTYSDLCSCRAILTCVVNEDIQQLAQENGLRLDQG